MNGRTEIQFRDQALDNAIREALRSDITQTGLTTLKRLDADGKGICSLSGLERATNLAHLSLMDNEIESISEIAGLIQLVTLRLRGNPFVDLSPLTRLAQLRELCLGGFWVNEDVGVLTLEAYGPVWGPAIINIAPLARLQKLSTLEISHHQLRDISPLANLTGLTRLALDGHNGGGPIKNYAPLSLLSQLVHLSLVSNRFKSTDLAALNELKHLRHIDLRANEINNIQALVENRHLGVGVHIDLRRNPLDEQARNEHIPQLLAHGVQVIWDSNGGAER